MDNTLLRQLKDYCPTALPMHMPGHKRNAADADYLRDLGAAWDVTEVDGLDDLHHPEGALRRAMARAAALWGSRRAFFSVNGSTAALLSAIWACTRDGDELILGRNCHKSVYNGLLLRRLRPVYLAPGHLTAGICGPIDPADVEQALAAHPEAPAVVLTSPTYDGVCSNVPAIAALVHRRGKVLIVDQAHGAHFGFGHGFPESAVREGADLVIHSVHKTLPSLTQTALLHLCSDRVDDNRLQNAMAIFQSSSPSYLLMASIDGCTGLLSCKGDALFTRWQQALNSFYDHCKSLRRLRLLTGPGHDRSKVVISTECAALTGTELADRLRDDHRIELEMAAPRYATALTGLGDTVESLDALAHALLQIDETAAPAEKAPFPLPPVPRSVMSPAHAMDRPGAHVAPGDAVGRTCLEFVWAYPPGVPLLAPGEIIDAAAADLLTAYGAEGVSLRSTTCGMPDKIFVEK